MTPADITNENRYLGELVPKICRYAGLGGLALLVASVVLGWAGEAGLERFLRSYLVAFFFVLSLSLGGLFFVLLQHLTRAGWSVVVRRIAEGLADNLKWLWIPFIPILVAVWTGHLYDWADPSRLSEAERALFQHKEPFLTPWFWTIRAAVYFGVWAWLARFFVNRSVQQDATGDPQTTTRMQSVAAPGMILYAFTQTFAAVDWIMTLEFAWYSTMFGVYFFAASTCGAFAAMIIILYLLQRSGRLTNVITTEHYHDLGKLLFAFGVVFWAYIAYSQYMLIWYANIQEETIWFVIRQLGGWKTMSIFLILGHFAGPFLILISRYPKRWKGVLAIGAAWMLGVHFIDLYWLVMPAIPDELIQSVTTYSQLVTEFEASYLPEYDLHWRVLDLTCLLGVLGVFVAMAAWSMRNRSLVPERDPRLDESLAFENY
ncbi:MAG: quinol:cytochrome C oxidoreductase [Planctomycetes bacterium]|nr:quinol:cytochrome C oxidoreductase [Planctomycetota bacterium]